MTDLCHLPAHELIRLMSDKTVSCREVIEAHLVRIEAVNPALNALVSAADPQWRLDAADDADNLAARGDPLGKAHGLPVVVKDVIRVAGLACSGGSPVLRSVAREDATAAPTTRPTAAAASVNPATTPASQGSNPPTAESQEPAAFSAMRSVCSALSTMELLWESVFLGGDRGRGFAEDLRAMGASGTT